MLAPKGSTFNGRPTFANPMYLKKAQSKKPCLYEIPYDTSDLANRFTPDREETLTLKKESRSKFYKDLVKPYDYTKQNSLYEIFKPPSKEYHDQLAHVIKVRKKMWRKSFVKTKLKFFKYIGFLPNSKSISKSRQAYNVMTNNINHFRELVDQAWEKHSHDHFRAPTAHDMEILIKPCLMPLALKTQNDSFTFVHELKQEMHADLKYVESLEKEIDELESDKAEFSNMYDLLLQERVIYKANVSRPPLRSTQMKDKVVPNNSQVKDKKTEVEDHHRISSISNKTKSVTACNDSLKSKTLNVNAVCATCGNFALESTIQNSKSYYRILYEKTSKAWKWWIEQQCPSGYKWVPKTKMEWVPKIKNENVKKRVSFAIDNIVQLILFKVDSGCTKHMTGNLKLLCNFVKKYLDTTTPSQQELDLLFGPLYDELFTAGISSVNKSSYPIDNSNQQDTPPTTNIQPTTEPVTPITTVHAEENNDNQAEHAHF
ncbi:hypothetical protein Tco_0442327 [Tanacetum coccineum]